jgi:geranylgeranyl diphosphate synthase type II
MTEQALTFEAAMARLEQLVAELESGKLSLEDSLKKFEEGITLGKTCRDFLDSADVRIRTLTAEAGAGADAADDDDDALAAHHAGMRDAIRYTLLGGGKRMRPLLCLWTHDVFGGSGRGGVLDAACAVECVHTYSLVHDDLPCMDDDDFRRGRPSAHRRFGEATAVLTGDALLTLAFEILATIPSRYPLAPERVLAATTTLSHAAGTAGLISGQALDLDPPAPRDENAVHEIHRRKTAALIAAAMEIGAILAGGGDEERQRARRAGTEAGLAFQIVDDILDIEGGQETLGKTPGKDVDRGKLTLPSVIGVEAARARARRHMEGALAALPEAGATPLAALIRHVTERSR